TIPNTHLTKPGMLLRRIGAIWLSAEFPAFAQAARRKERIGGLTPGQANARVRTGLGFLRGTVQIPDWAKLPQDARPRAPREYAETDDGRLNLFPPPEQDAVDVAYVS